MAAVVTASCVTLALICLAGLGAAPAAVAAPPRPAGAGTAAVVERVVDGDTLWLAPAAGGVPYAVRLLDIDAPELCQEGGAEARQFLLDLVRGRPVRLVVPPGAAGRDAQGRTLGTLWLDDVQVNRRLVEEGQAWSVRIKWDQGPYVPQERMAKALSRGLHRNPGALMPRDFRARHGPCR